MDADDPRHRRRALVSAIVEARQADVPVTFEARGENGGAAAGTRVTYEDRSLRLELDSEERERLEDLLAEYHVLKVAQPATRKADDGVVHLSAVTDPKHLADFLESLFREVYGAPEDYGLEVG